MGSRALIVLLSHNRLASIMRHFDSSIPPLRLSFLKTVKLARKNFIQLNNPSLCLHSQPIFEQNNHRDWAGIVTDKDSILRPKELEVLYLHSTPKDSL